MRDYKAEISRAKTTAELSKTVVDYLESIGEAENACGETFEETAERLNDAVMDAAVEKCWELHPPRG